MALYERGVAGAGFYHVRVDRALNEVIDFADLFCLGFEHADEFLADYFSLTFGIGHSGEFCQKALGSIDGDKIDVILTSEKAFDFLAFVLSEKAVVNEDAGEVFADCLMQKQGGDRGIDTAGKGAKHLFVADAVQRLG